MSFDASFVMHCSEHSLFGGLALHSNPQGKTNENENDFGTRCHSDAAHCITRATTTGQPERQHPSRQHAEQPAESGAPAAGANSFTESQAKSRIETNGFANVSGLAKDSEGVWRGKAMKGSQSVHVSVDFQGNVTPR